MGEKDKDDKPRKLAKRLMWSEASRETKSLVVGGLAMVVSSYANQAVPRLIGRLIDQSSERNNANSTQTMVKGFLTIGLIGGSASFLRTLMLDQAQESIASRLRERIFASLMADRGIEWFQSKRSTTSSEEGEEDDAEEETKSKEADIEVSPATIGVILNEDVNTVAKAVTVTTAGLFRSLSSCVFATTNMLLLNSNLVALTVLVAPVVGSVALLTRKRLKKLEAKKQEASLAAAAFVEERLNHIHLVKLSNRERDEISKYNEIQKSLIGFGRKTALANSLSMGTMFFMSTSALCAVLFRGGKAVEQKKMDHGQLVSFGTYSMLLALGSAGVVRAMGDYARGTDAAERLLELLNPSNSDSSSPEPVVSKTDLESSQVEEMVLENVNFAFRNDPSKPVLRDLTISLNRGKVVVLTGKNGSGKSTLTMLLAGLYEPQSGKITLTTSTGSQDFLNDFALSEKARLVQVVTQTPSLFNGSVLENVRYAQPNATEEEVKSALKAANFDAFGLDYEVGRNGSRLSGGQRQRLCIARALLRKPIFLVLDEPTSSLDRDGESAVADAIRASKASNCALLVVTHNAKTLELADRVVVLKEGRVVEEGTLPELKSRQGELCSLMKEDFH